MRCKQIKYGRITKGNRIGVADDGLFLAYKKLKWKIKTKAYSKLK